MEQKSAASTPPVTPGPTVRHLQTKVEMELGTGCEARVHWGWGNWVVICALTLLACQ